jgi:hypothetical protein
VKASKMTKPKPPKQSKGFTLPAELLAAIGGGSYDSINLKNKGGQTVNLTRFGAGGFDSVDVNGKGKVSLSRIPEGAADAAEVETVKSSGGGKRTVVKKGGVSYSWAKLPTAAKAGIIAGGAGVVVVIGAVVALR